MLVQALSDGDRERCRSLLFDARQEAVRSLATVSTESVSSVNPAILQLQQLQCVQEAWDFRWPSLSLASPPSPGVVTSAKPVLITIGSFASCNIDCHSKEGRCSMLLPHSCMMHNV